MVISISGAQCTGKSTLIHYMKTSGVASHLANRFGRIEFTKCGSRSEVAKSLGINENGGDLGQLYIASTELRYLLAEGRYSSGDENQHVIRDRSMLDVYVYTQ